MLRWLYSSLFFFSRPLPACLFSFISSPLFLIFYSISSRPLCGFFLLSFSHHYLALRDICRPFHEPTAGDVERSSRISGAGVGFVLLGRFLHGHERSSQRFPGQHPLRRPLFAQSRGTHLAQSTARAQMARLPLQRHHHVHPRIQPNHHTRASSPSAVLQRQFSTVRAFCLANRFAVIFCLSPLFI